MNPPMPNPPVPNAPAPYYPAPNGPQYGAPPYQPAPGPYAPAPYGAPSMAAPPMYAPPAPAPVVVPVVMAPPPPRALVNPNCPPGLEYLTQVDQLVVIQEVDMLQVFTGYESHNRYSVKNAANQNVYYCVETSDVLTMNLMHSDRPFEIIVMDNFGVPVLRASRPYHFGSILCGCPDLLQVSTGNGQPLGTVQEVGSEGAWEVCKSSSYCSSPLSNSSVVALVSPCTTPTAVWCSSSRALPVVSTFLTPSLRCSPPTRQRWAPSLANFRASSRNSTLRLTSSVFTSPLTSRWR